MKRFCLVMFSALLALVSCKNDNEEKCVFTPDTKGISLDLKVESLEDSLPSVTSKKQLVRFLTHHPHLRDNFFGRANYPDDSVFINQLYARFTNPHIGTLLMETHKVFGNNDNLMDEFRQAFINMKYYYPDFHPPKIQTIISGLETGCDMFVSDTLIVIGLDFFLGKGAKYRPLNMYEYMLRRYHPGGVVPAVLLLYGIDPGFNRTRLSDKT